MKGVTALLLFAVVGCHAGVMTIRTQVCLLSLRLLRHGQEGSAALQVLPRATTAGYRIMRGTA